MYVPQVNRCAQVLCQPSYLIYVKFVPLSKQEVQKILWSAAEIEERNVIRLSQSDAIDKLNTVGLLYTVVYDIVMS